MHLNIKDGSTLYHGTKPEYLMVGIKGNDFKWEYIK